VPLEEPQDVVPAPDLLDEAQEPAPAPLPMSLDEEIKVLKQQRAEIKVAGKNATKTIKAREKQYKKIKEHMKKLSRDEVMQILIGKDAVVPRPRPKAKARARN
jgi:cyanophycinase-like exopeptidase